MQESPSTFRYVFLGHGTQAQLLVEPAGERAPGAQAMHDLPFRYVSMGHLSLQVKSPIDPAHGTRLNGVAGESKKEKKRLRGSNLIV